ncbi:RHS repeat-associated protein [Aquimarina sp. MAR_2010_214]|uniref:RHS repeat domain-containing protein n=1 Tax=Aquimarina sp. MAR_2010_214 TaxID=1250026 RepID=UPI000C70BA55|nr:RHS repeat-associated core domain-containing protein [Aquimarina sp. MAR_2010_214]PKV52452.1 RHS repeat-associated protein [Aquimarina sp. MAR_2010_214]
MFFCIGYAVNGNMIKDQNKGITGITYNHLNLPKTVTINNASHNGNITYIYDATGVKLKKITTEGSSLTTEYAGNYIYKNGTLEFFNHAEGYVEKEADGYKYVYQFKDHLGNIRLSYKDADKNGSITQSEIIEEKNYYPFGLEHKGYNFAVNGSKHNYGFNGIEFTESLDLNLYEMDLRQYDPAIARWTSIDPVTHYSNSTYNGFDNNPVFWADPSGASVEQTENGTTYTGEDAKVAFLNLRKQYGSGNSKNEEETNPQDDITVNSEGVVTNVVKNNDPNRFFDEDGNELSFHDSEGVDKPYITGTYRRGDRLFYSVSTEQMNEEIMNRGLIMQRWLSKRGGPQSGVYYMWSLFSARNKGHGDFDFAEQYLADLIENPSLNTGRNRSSTTYNDGAGFFRLGNTNNIYNLYDAGNYMWGKAMGMSGFSYGEVRIGSQANETFRDSKADQRAIKKGFNGN